MRKTIGMFFLLWPIVTILGFMLYVNWQLFLEALFVCAGLAGSFILGIYFISEE